MDRGEYTYSRHAPDTLHVTLGAHKASFLKMCFVFLLRSWLPEGNASYKNRPNLYQVISLRLWAGNMVKYRVSRDDLESCNVTFGVMVFLFF